MFLITEFINQKTVEMSVNVTSVYLLSVVHTFWELYSCNWKKALWQKDIMATALPRFFVMLKTCLMSGKNSSNLSAAQDSKHDPSRLGWIYFCGFCGFFVIYIFKFSRCACSQVVFTVFTLHFHPNKLSNISASLPRTFPKAEFKFLGWLLSYTILQGIRWIVCLLNIYELLKKPQKPRGVSMYDRQGKPLFQNIGHIYASFSWIQ